MEINYKQQELIEELFNTVKAKFPEIEFVGLGENPDYKDHILIKVVADMDDERRNDMREFAIDRAIEILDNYGYLFSVMQSNKNLIAA